MPNAKCDGDPDTSISYLSVSAKEHGALAQRINVTDTAESLGEWPMYQL